MNDELLYKIRSLTKKYHEREEEYEEKYKNLEKKLDLIRFEEKKSREEYEKRIEELQDALGVR